MPSPVPLASRPHPTHSARSAGLKYTSDSRPGIRRVRHRKGFRYLDASGKVGLTREKVLAAVVQLLEKTLIRVGNDEYAKHNQSFGLTTMRDGHVAIKGECVLDGSMLDTVAQRANRLADAAARLSEGEAAVLALLQRRLARNTKRKAS